MQNQQRPTEHCSGCCLTLLSIFIDHYYVLPLNIIKLYYTTLNRTILKNSPLFGPRRWWTESHIPSWSHWTARPRSASARRSDPSGLTCPRKCPGRTRNPWWAMWILSKHLECLDTDWPINRKTWGCMQNIKHGGCCPTQNMIAYMIVQIISLIRDWKETHTLHIWKHLRFHAIRSLGSWV